MKPIPVTTGTNSGIDQLAGTAGRFEYGELLV
jgi:hypothetical protein